MLRHAHFILLTVSVLLPSAFAQVAFPTSVTAFSEAASLGVELSARKAERNGSITSEKVQCIRRTARAQLEPTVARLMKDFLSEEELRTTEVFLSGSVGRKYSKHGVLQVYQAVGEQLPEPLPDFSDDEYKQLEQFAATSAGSKLIHEKVMQSQKAQQAYGIDIRRVVSSCTS